MQRDKEIALLDELLGLRQAKSAYLDEDVSYSDAGRYIDPDRFQAERTRLFRAHPVILAHASELANDGDFLVREHAGLQVLLTRDRHGTVHAFLNVCRHRGMQLVSTEQGCRHGFTCPYHAWTWDNAGRLIGIPHREQGFPDLDTDRYSLKRISVAVGHGWIWVEATGEMDVDIVAASLAEDSDWIGMASHVIHAVTEREWVANWKITVEGEREADHFRVAHAKTIAGLFHDNLSTYDVLGPHIRSVLARNTVDTLAERPRKEWSIWEDTNLLYTLVPGPIFLVQSDHVVWLSIIPRGVDCTLIRLITMKPADGGGKDDGYWDKNHALTTETLYEDFEIAGKIHAGLGTGAKNRLTFGRYEGALDVFNANVGAAIGSMAEPQRLHA